jgi:hypothetical protein
MAINTKIETAVPNLDSNFAMVLGPELGQLMSRVQSVMVSMGHYIHRVIDEMLNPYDMSVDEIDSFLGVGRGLARYSEFDIGYFTWDKFTDTKFYQNAGIGEFRMGDGRKVSRPDYFIVVNAREGAYLIVVEQKIGAKFDTKSVVAERDALSSIYSMIKPYTRHLHVCPVIATTSCVDTETLNDGFKRILPIDLIEDGVVALVRNEFLFNTIGIPYVMEDRMAEIRAENARFFIDQVNRV